MFGAFHRLCPIQANRTAWQQYLKLATFTTLFEMPVANWLTYPTANLSETLGWPTDRLGGYVRKSHSYFHARRRRRAAAAAATTTAYTATHSPSCRHPAFSQCPSRFAALTLMSPGLIIRSSYNISNRRRACMTHPSSRPFGASLPVTL